MTDHTIRSLNESLYGTDLLGDAMAPDAKGPLHERFLFPPFSVLDARQGVWQDRKRAWIGIGIRGEAGRGTFGYCSEQALMMAGGYFECDGKTAKSTGTTSVFDPTLCELAYRWFCPDGGQVVDPFAGGSVRGIVACMLNRHYWGCDLRQEQIDANEQQADEIKPDIRPVWVCGDSTETLAAAPPADFVFSCPPYGDLEKYSDDPRDLSSMEWHTFTAAYKRIIHRACSNLKQDRFACFVVGDFRDGRGFYRDFVSETIRGFKESGLELYNEAILVTSVGSASMRAGKQFSAGRKLVKTHQNVLVFCKGNWRKAASAIRELWIND